MKPRILVIDDDTRLRSTVSSFLSRQGFAVNVGSSMGEADAKLREIQPDGLVLDMMLPDGNSLDYLEEFRASYPDMGILVMTGEADVERAVRAMQLGADNFLSKPVELPHLLESLKKAVDLRHIRRSRSVGQRSTKVFAPFFGQSEAWLRTRELADIMAKNDSVALLTGPTGTGKGMLARYIHEQSERSDQPMVSINCSGLRGDMLGSELFGHAKGAFTSAVQDKQGLFDLAHGGTLFLDEIGDMDFALQPAFLKVLEDKRYRRLGEVKDRVSEFRLICATNRNLEAACREKQFREDLLFRINVFPIRLTPLREMPEDLAALCDHLLQELDHPGLPLSTEAREILARYTWPGNVRELRNVLERALLLSGGAPLEAKHLLGLENPMTLCEDVPGDAAHSPPPSTLNLAQLEKQRIQDALDRAGGKVGKAAELLGISRATLYRRLQKAEPSERKGAV